MTIEHTIGVCEIVHSDHERGDLTMKQRSFILITLVLSVLGLSMVIYAQANVATVTGLWIMSNPTPAGMAIATLQLDQHGSEIKGTMKPENGNAIPLDRVTVKHNQITFSVTRKEKNAAVVVQYTGTVQGDSMEGTFRQDNHSVEWKAKRNPYNE